jgi:hypothetical protein
VATSHRGPPTYEHRLAAIVADPGQVDVGGKFAAAMTWLGLDEAAVARLPAIDPADEEKIVCLVDQDRSMRWKIVQRGFWTNGAPTLSSWLSELARWKLVPAEIAAIRCPTLVTAAQSDMASSNARELYDALRSEDAHRVLRRRRRGDALRDAEPLAGEPHDPRLARRDAQPVIETLTGLTHPRVRSRR